MLRPAFRPLLISGLLILSASARPAAAQTFVPVPIGTPVSQLPTTTLMPFTADAYPKVSTATGGSLLKTAQLQASGKEVLADRLLVKFQPTTTDADRLDVHQQAS